MAAAPEDNVRNYLLAAMQSRNAVDLLDLRRQWHDRHQVAMTQGADPDTAVLSETGPAPRPAGLEYTGEVDGGAVDPQTRELQWQELKEFWHRAPSQPAGDSLEQLNPFLRSSWHDIRDAALRSRWSLEHRGEFEAAWPRSLPLTLRDQFFQLLLQPASQTLSLREMVRQELHQSANRVSDFRKYLKRLEGSFPDSTLRTYQRLHSDLVASLIERRQAAELRPAPVESTYFQMTLPVLIAVFVLRSLIPALTKNSFTPPKPTVDVSNSIFSKNVSKRDQEQILKDLREEIEQCRVRSATDAASETSLRELHRLEAKITGQILSGGRDGNYRQKLQALGREVQQLKRAQEVRQGLDPSGMSPVLKQEPP